MTDRNVIDAEFRVLAPRHEWRIRFWPSVLFWLYVTGVVGAAEQMLPNVDKGSIVSIVVIAAMVGPGVRIGCAIVSALTGGNLLDEQAAQLERQRRLARGQ